jgi:hypothetical protein
MRVARGLRESMSTTTLSKTRSLPNLVVYVLS